MACTTKEGWLPNQMVVGKQTRKNNAKIKGIKPSVLRGNQSLLKKMITVWFCKEAYLDECLLYLTHHLQWENILLN